MNKHPMQPIVKDKHRSYRFKRNEIINWLFETGKLDLNQIAVMPFSDEDKIQLAQLLGYSVDGFCQLSYVSQKIKDEADNIILNRLAKADMKKNEKRYLPIITEDGNLRKIEDVEKEMIKLVASKVGSTAEAARQLGIGRSTLYRKMEKYGIENVLGKNR